MVRNTSANKNGLPKAQFVIFSLCLFILQFVNHVDAAFGNKKRKVKELEEEQALKTQEAFDAEEAAANEMRRTLGITYSSVALFFTVVFIFAFNKMFKLEKDNSENRGVVVTEKPLAGNRPAATLDVVIVGCGLPKRGMGWYHLIQLLEMENVNIRGVVEPFFMNPALCPNKPASFEEFETTTSKLGVQFVKSVEELGTFKKKTLCLIAGRTTDNPKLFAQCLANGSSYIYLEKPGAPTVSDLKDMKSRADIMGAKVYLGYNKNVTPYVTKALAKAKTIKGSSISFVHNNSYKEKELAECFERNAEGMLKNMAIHELALLVTFFGVTVETITDFEVVKDRKYSQKLTFGKFTDFSKVAFQITTNAGNTVAVQANRCGGNVSWATVVDAQKNEVAKFEFPDADTQAKVDAQTKADPEMMPYFFVQSGDYQELKDRVVDACITGKEADGVATITVAVEALRLAEYVTEKLKKAL